VKQETILSDVAMSCLWYFYHIN